MPSAIEDEKKKRINGSFEVLTVAPDSLCRKFFHVLWDPSRFCQTLFVHTWGNHDLRQLGLHAKVHGVPAIQVGF